MNGLRRWDTPKLAVSRGCRPAWPPIVEEMDHVPGDGRRIPCFVLFSLQSPMSSQQVSMIHDPCFVLPLHLHSPMSPSSGSLGESRVCLDDPCLHVVTPGRRHGVGTVSTSPPGGDRSSEPMRAACRLGKRRTAGFLFGSPHPIGRDLYIVQKSL